MKRLITIIALTVMIPLIYSCGKEGCTDRRSPNYDSKAKKDDGSCEYFTAFSGAWIHGGGFNIRSARNQHYQFEASEEDVIHITLTSGVNTIMYLMDRHLNVLDSSSMSTSAELEFTIPKTAEYRLVVCADDGAIGSFSGEVQSGSVTDVIALQSEQDVMSAEYQITDGTFEDVQSFRNSHFKISTVVDSAYIDVSTVTNGVPVKIAIMTDTGIVVDQTLDSAVSIGKTFKLGLAGTYEIVLLREPTSIDTTPMTVHVFDIGQVAQGLRVHGFRDTLTGSWTSAGGYDPFASGNKSYKLILSEDNATVDITVKSEAGAPANIYFLSPNNNQMQVDVTPGVNTAGTVSGLRAGEYTVVIAAESGKSASYEVTALGEFDVFQAK